MTMRKNSKARAAPADEGAGGSLVDAAQPAPEAKREEPQLLEAAQDAAQPSGAVPEERCLLRLSGALTYSGHGIRARRGDVVSVSREERGALLASGLWEEV